MDPKLRGDEEGERFMTGCLLALFIAMIFWAAAVMFWWSWMLS